LALLFCSIFSAKKMSSASPTDIITYVGVPLAVLGVLPILYNTAGTLTALSKVRRILRKSRLAGITRGDVINHVIEIEFPRFTIAPLDREDDAAEYWSIYDHPSLVPGGTWTIFNWKMHTVGLKTQRITYADELRQPQADIGFEELISYLLDLGAVPNAAGFRMLRTSGLWVPTGTALLLSPDRHEAVLTIASLNDSDGHLSLAVRWNKTWRMRNKSALPPYWILLSGPGAEQTILEEELLIKGQEPAATDPFVSETGNDEPSGMTDSVMSESAFEDLKKDGGSDARSSTSKDSKRLNGLRCHITIEGLHDAVPEHSDLEPSQHLDISHLEIRKTNSNTTGTWFASAATALSASSHTVLWNYHIPDEVLLFSRKETVPCGILVLLDIVEESATPEWATKYDDEAERRDLQMKKLREQGQAMLRENKLPPDQRQAAVRERMMKANDDWMEERRAQQRRDAQRAETRMLEALQSPKWDNKLVAEHNLAWLKSKGHVAQSYDVKRVVEILLFKMVRDTVLAASLTTMLDAWKAWVDNGGMARANYLMLNENQIIFAYASLILSVIKDSVTAVDGSLAMDLQESVKIWKRVRLG
jgi:hypothetical protein